MIEVVNEISRRPRSALWRGASDRLAQALVLAGEELGVPGDGQAKCSSCPLLDPAEREARLLAEREESG